MRIEFRRQDWPYLREFRIAYQVSTAAETIQVQLTDGPYVGRGEALGVSYHAETVESMLADLSRVNDALCRGILREELPGLLPPGGARNAVDCALWDVQAKKCGKRAWELVGFSSVRPIITDYTIGLDTADAMAQVAAGLHEHPVLKLKLCGTEDLERVLAVRAARPDAEIIVDANQSWTEWELRNLTPRFAEAGVRLIEQPLSVGQDDILLGYESPVPLCADESCQTADSLSNLVGKYQYLNIKLDKTGGLTEAMHLACEARRRGFKLMVGCMGGSSLSMAPAFIVAQLCEFADLDGPLLSSCDVSPAIKYEGGRMYPPPRELWG